MDDKISEIGNLRRSHEDDDKRIYFNKVKDALLDTPTIIIMKTILDVPQQKQKQQQKTKTKTEQKNKTKQKTDT